MKIIVADDHHTNRILVTEILRCMGHDSIEVSNGKEVLETLEANNDIDMVFMDIEMPVMTGYEALKYIREHMVHPKNNIPVVALTAHHEDMLDKSWFNDGFNDSILKPYSFERIQEIVNNFEKS